MSLKAAMKRRAGQMRYRRLEGIEAIVERQQCMSAKRDDDGFVLDGLGIDPIALGCYSACKCDPLRGFIGVQH